MVASLERQINLPDCRLTSMTTTIRIDDSTRERVRELAALTGKPMQSVVELAIADYERKLFWQRIDERYAELRTDESMWADVEAERADEEGALRDGLE
jgi:predicted transcriptional regulator